MFGSIARGVVIALAGVFFIVAAATADPKKATGLDGALHSLQNLTGGPFILGLVALGLVSFGFFGFPTRWAKSTIARPVSSAPHHGAEHTRAEVRADHRA